MTLLPPPPYPSPTHLSLILHILLETPASISFFFSPSSTLSAPQPHAHPVIRQYSLLLLMTNLLVILIMYSHPLSPSIFNHSGGGGGRHIGRNSPASVGSLTKDSSERLIVEMWELFERRVAGLLVGYHVGTLVRAWGRLRRGEGMGGGLKGAMRNPGVHLLVHGFVGGCLGGVWWGIF